MDHRSDIELMALVREGDYQAFDALYERYREPIRRFLYSLGGDAQGAEDGVQEVFLRLFRARHRYAPTGCFTTYIFQIARRHWLTQRRRQVRAGESPLLDRDGARPWPFAGVVLNERVEPELHLLEEYRRRRIRQAILDLPERQRLVFVLAHLEEMRYADIGVVLGIPEGTVKSRMFAAVRALQKRLREEEP